MIWFGIAYSQILSNFNTVFCLQHDNGGVLLFCAFISILDQRTVHLKILVSNSNATQLVRDSSQFTLCGQYIGRSGDGSIATIKCPVGVTGRWIRIQEDYPTLEYLHMCEVEVFGF